MPPKKGCCSAGEIHVGLRTTEYVSLLPSLGGDVAEYRLNILNVQTRTVWKTKEITPFHNRNFNVRKIFV